MDVLQNTYYDFKLKPGSSYPLKGVTYSVDYGNIPGYTAEDGHELDLFVGNKLDDSEQGCIFVDRGPDIPHEHKFYVGLTTHEVAQIEAELKPVLIEHTRLNTVEDLLDRIEEFKDKE